MSDSNGTSTNLKRARSSSPVNGSTSPGGKKQNTGSASTKTETDDTEASKGDAAALKPAEGNMDATRTGSGSEAEQGKPSDDTASKAAASVADNSANPAPSTTATGEAAAPAIAIRALIVTQDASIIIGKGGSHIKEIRDRAGAKVSVSEQQSNNPERVLTVSGPLDAVSKAFGLIVRKINDEPYDQPSLPGSRAVTIKYLIPNSRMGSVIGKGGSKIKEIQEASGARLQASDAMLQNSTERVLSVSGVADAVHIAVYYVGTILQEGLDRATPNTPYKPGPIGPAGYPGAPAPYGAPGGAAYPPGAPPSGSRGYGGAAGGSSYYPQAQPGFGFGGAPAPPAGAGAAGPYGTASTAAAPGSQTQQIYIPNELVGNIIGKGGQKINEIRQMSGCGIKIMELSESQGAGARPNERLVTITGLTPNIATAVQMLHTRLESEKQKKMTAGGF